MPILDNTLNFTAGTTTERDRHAATHLAKIANTTLKDFTDWYLPAVSANIVANLAQALLNDCKPLKSPLDHNATLGFGQLSLWDAKDVIAKRRQIQEIMNAHYSNWVVSVIYISECQNYLHTSSETLDNYFVKLLNLKQRGSWLVSNQLYLRKEIIGKTIQNENARPTRKSSI